MQDSKSTLAYLDTCIISGLAKEDLPATEQQALHDIVRLHKAGAVKLVTSSVAKEEIDRISPDARARHEVIYSLVSNIPTAKSEWTDSGLTLLGVGGGRRMDPVFRDLEQLLPDRTDAEHVFQAVKSEVEFFITTDARTILKFSAEIESEFGIKPVAPSEFTTAID